MSAIEGAVSVASSVGTSVAAGPSIGAGPSMSGEFSVSGIGFDGGSASFSGLGRSDTGFAPFSVNEGPIGPVSFSNSTDLFTDTKAVSTPTFFVPEGPVKGDVFGKTEFIAQNQSLISDSARRGLVENISLSEPISIFDKTSPFQAMMPVNEGPVQSFSFKDTVELAGIISEPASAEPIFEISAQPEVNIESILESIVSSQAEHGDFSAETVRDAIEDLGAENPVAAYTLRQDLAIADNIIQLAHEIAEPQTAARISNIAIDIAVERAGIIEKIRESEEVETEKADTEVEPETEASSQPESDDIQRSTDSDEMSGEDYIWDEGANAAREEDAALAIDVTFETGVDPETEKVTGEDVVAAMNPTPSDKEKSKLAKEEGIDGDGSYDGLTDTLEHKVFDSEEEARAAAKDAILNNPGVKRGKGKTKATDEQQVKVLRGGKPREKQLKIAT